MNENTPKELTGNENKSFDNDEIYPDPSNEESEDNRSLLKLDFDGKAYIFSPDRKYKKEEYAELIQILNRHSNEISEKIIKEIRAKAPVGLDVKTQLEFNLGSLGFEGVIQIIDFLDKLNGAKELVISVITLILNNVIRQEIEEKGNVTVSSINSNVTVGKVGRDNFKLYTKFLWWCSGAMIDLLKSCPTDKVKYETIGAAVFTTGLLAFLSGGYAIYTVFDGDPNALFNGLCFGSLWGAIIFNLDKSIVSSMRKETTEDFNWFQKVLKEFPPAIPRIALAILLGFTISKPLELRLFQSPILAQIDLSKDDYAKEKSKTLSASFRERINEIDNRLNQINQQINASDGKVSLALAEYNGEIDGSRGSRKYGVGTVAGQKFILLTNARTAYNNVLSELNDERNSLIKEKTDISKQITADSQKAKENIKNDFLTRFKALWGMTVNEEDRSVFWIDWAIVFLLIAVELTPIFVKLLSPSGTYDARLNQREKTESRDAELRKDTIVREAEYNRDTAVHEAQCDFESKSGVADYRKQATIDISQHHYEKMTGSEKTFDEQFFGFADTKREEILENDFNIWVANHNLTDLSFEDFHRTEIKRLSLNKNISI